MGRQPCCEKVGLKKGPWAVEEDRKLITFMTRHGHSCWREVPKLAGLLRCGKSCRLRWTNYLRPDLKRGMLSDAEEKLVIDLHAAIGNRWSRIAAQLPGRTDNEIKNYWNTRIKKKLKLMGIDPTTHEPFNELPSSTTSDALKHRNKSTTISTSITHVLKTSSESTSCPNNPSDQDINETEDPSHVLKSKRERLEIESREAHLRVQKMKEALLAFNSRFARDSSSSSTLIKSPTLPKFEGFDESLFIDRPAHTIGHHIHNYSFCPRPPFNSVPNKKLEPSLIFPFSPCAPQPSPPSSYNSTNGDLYYDANSEESKPFGTHEYMDTLLYEEESHPQHDPNTYGHPQGLLGHTTPVDQSSPYAPLSNHPTPFQETTLCRWIKEAMASQEKRESFISPDTTTLEMSSPKSSFIPSFALLSPCYSDASSWYSLMQQASEDGSTPQSTTTTSSSTTATLSSDITNYAPLELQHLASLLGI